MVRLSFHTIHPTSSVFCVFLRLPPFSKTLSLVSLAPTDTSTRFSFTVKPRQYSIGKPTDVQPRIQSSISCAVAEQALKLRYTGWSLSPAQPDVCILWSEQSIEQFTVLYNIMSASLRNFAIGLNIFSKHPTSPGSELRLSSLKVMINIGLGQVGGKTLGRHTRRINWRQLV